MNKEQTETEETETPATAEPAKPSTKRRRQMDAVKIETKMVKHVFTPDERLQYGSELAREINALSVIESEFDDVKASYKSKTATCENRIKQISTNIGLGFEMRQKRCRVAYDVPRKVKNYFLEDDPPDAAPVLTEPMSGDDFQMELIAAESAFEAREELHLFPQAGDDRGVLAIGRQEGRWFTALRIQVGRQKIEERLDAEQRSTKERLDAIKQGCKRAIEWLDESLGEQNAKGFIDRIREIPSRQQGRVE